MRRMYSKPQLLEAVEQEAEVNGLKAFENIVDKDGHKRFIEGDIVLDESAPEGFTKTYGKWTLSGSHLMIVLAMTITSGVSVGASTLLANVDLPKWIKDKIYAVYGNYVMRITTLNIGTGTDTSFGFTLRKEGTSPNEVIKIRPEAFTTSREEHVRAEFDLLIDNE